MSQKYVARVNAFIEPYLEKNGYSLILSEFTEEDHNWYLRLFIDLSEAEAANRAASLAEDTADAPDAGKAGAADTEAETACASEGYAEEEEPEEEAVPEPAVTINDCAKVSRYLSKWLDKEDFIKETYTLEVCSRGFLPKDKK